MGLIRKILANRFVGNVFWAAADKISLVIGNFLVIVVLANGTSPALVGEFSFAVSVMWLASPLVHLGMEGIVTRRSVNRPPDEQHAVENALAATFTAALVFIGIIMACAMAYIDEPVTRLLTMIICVRLVLFATFPIAGWLQANYQAHVYVRPKTVVTLLGTGLTVAVFLWTGSVVAAAMVMAAEALVIAAIMIAIVLGRRGLSRLTVRPATIRTLLREALPVMVSAVSIVIYQKIDQVMVRAISGPAETGYYAVAARLSEGLGFVAVAVAHSLLPVVVAEIAASDRAGAARRLQPKLDVMAGLCFCVMGFWLVAGGPVITALFGEAFAPAIPILMVHLASFLFIGTGLMQSCWLIATGQQKYMMIVTATGLGANLLLNAVLIPPMGAMGAAVATVISYAASGYLMALAIPNLRGLFVKQTKALLLPLRIFHAFPAMKTLLSKDIRIVKTA